MTKISELPALSTPNGTETVVIVKDGVTKRTGIGPLVAAAAAPYVLNGFVSVPVLTVNGRRARPTKITLDLYVVEWDWEDTGVTEAPLLPDPRPPAALAKTFLPVPPVIFNGRPFQGTLISLDLCMPVGQFLDGNREPFIAGLTGGASASSRTAMRVIQTPTALRIFFRGAEARWTEFLLQRDTYAGSNGTGGGFYDVWHNRGQWDCTLSSFTPTRLQQLIRTDAEMEIAVLTADALSLGGYGAFVGGSVHGWQILNAATMTVDGISTPLGQTDTYECEGLTVTQSSALYRYGSTAQTSDKIADVLTIWRFSKGQVRVTTQITWAASLTSNRCEVGMLPGLRNNGAIDIITSAQRSPDYAGEDLSNSTAADFSTPAQRIVLTSASGYVFVIETIEGWHKANRRKLISRAINNKVYNDPLGTGYVTTVGEVTRVTNIYTIHNPF